MTNFPDQKKALRLVEGNKARPSEWGRAVAFVFAVIAACLCLTCLSTPQVAWADVRTTDLLYGETVEERGMSAVNCPNISAEYAYCVDADGTVYFERNANEQTQIASITKVMTALVAVDLASLTDTITVTPEAATVGESTASLMSGDTMTLEAALTGLLVSSGNDAAIAISDTLGQSLKTSESQTAAQAFAKAMNEKAAELGMKDTKFANAHGLDFGNYDMEMYSTAHDVALMCAAFMKNDALRKIVDQKTAEISVTRSSGKKTTIKLDSTDLLLGTYKGACGIKTGYTDQAGECFAGACKRKGSPMLFAIVLNAPTEQARFDDTATLFDWVYDNHVDYPLVHANQKVTAVLNEQEQEVPVVAEISHRAWPDKTVKATIADPDASVNVFALDGNISQEVLPADLNGSIKMGDVLGVINFYQNNQLIATQDLIAAEDSPAPGFFEGLQIAWNRFWSGTDECADTIIVNDTPYIYGKSKIIAAATEDPSSSEEETPTTSSSDDSGAAE